MARYEPLEVDGCWYVLDHLHPDAAPAKCADENDAKLNARVWNLVTEPDPRVLGIDGLD